jgi:hypothetical protein
MYRLTLSLEKSLFQLQNIRLFGEVLLMEAVIWLKLAKGPSFGQNALITACTSMPILKNLA